MWLAAIYSAAIALVIAVAALIIIWNTRDRSIFFHLMIASLSGGVVVIVASAAAVQLMVLTANDLAIIMTAAIIGAAVSAGVALALGLRVQAGSRQLHAMTRAIAAGIPPLAPRANTSREFFEVGTALKNAAAELHQAKSREQQLERARVEAISWISHDLRTPLAGIRAMSESIEDGIAADPAMYLRWISEQTDALGGLVDDLVEYSSVLSARGSLAEEPVDLAAIATSVVTSLRPIASQRGVTIILTLPAGVRGSGDHRRLHRAFQNVVENAVRYTAAGSAIEVKLDVDSDGVMQFDVADECGTVDKAVLSRAFDPGWRGDESRMSSPGTGLGLAIVQSVVSAHGGVVSTESIASGCRFRLRLPGFERQSD